MGKFVELDSFSHVSRSGSFRGAAADLGLSASAVSKHVRALEERLGVRLLNRTTRRVSLTEAGRTFFDRIGPLLSELGEAEEEVTELQTELRGGLRISGPMDFGLAHLAPALAGFASLHPQIDLHLEFSDRFVDVVEEGFDVVIRIGDVKDTSLVARRLGPCRRVICASPDYLDRHGVPKRPRDLLHHSRVGYAYETERSFVFRGKEAINKSSERVNIPIRHRTNSGELSRQLVLAGHGIALLPTFLVAEDIRAGRLQVLLPGQMDDAIPIQAIYPHRKHLSAKVRSLVDHLVDHCGQEPYWDEGLELAGA